MNNNVNDQLRSAMQQYTGYIIPAITIFVCLLLFIQYIVPQFQAWLALQQQISDMKHQLEVMNTNLRLVQGLDDQNLTDNLQLTVSALPAEKDLLGILGAISRGSVNAGVSIGDYSFSQIGGNSTVSTEQTFDLNLSVSGTYDNVKKFVAEMKKQLPLSNVTDVRYGTGGNATVVVSFYYKDFPNLTFHDDQAINGLSERDNQLITELHQYGQTSPDDDLLFIPTLP